MPNQPKTPAHTVRVPDELWVPAVAVAAARGETISDAIRQGLTDYVKAAEDATVPDELFRFLFNGIWQPVQRGTTVRANMDGTVRFIYPSPFDETEEPGGE